MTPKRRCCLCRNLPQLDPAIYLYCKETNLIFSLYGGLSVFIQGNQRNLFLDVWVLWLSSYKKASESPGVWLFWEFSYKTTSEALVCDYFECLHPSGFEREIKFKSVLWSVFCVSLYRRTNACTRDYFECLYTGIQMQPLPGCDCRFWVSFYRKTSVFLYIGLFSVSLLRNINEFYACVCNSFEVLIQEYF